MPHFLRQIIAEECDLADDAGSASHSFGCGPEEFIGQARSFYLAVHGVRIIPRPSRRYGVKPYLLAQVKISVSGWLGGRSLAV